MSWTITPSSALVDDPDAMTYLAAVEAADGQALESGVRLAVNSFIKGCKADGIWPAIKASCILAGARTLAGCLVPLVGTAPTNPSNIFVQADYDRKTGLVGNGSTKYLDSNRAASTDPLNSFHLGIYVNTAGSGTQMYIGGMIVNTNDIYRADTVLALRSRGGGAVSYNGQGGATGFLGQSRFSSSSFMSRVNNSSQSNGNTSVSADAANIFIFARNNNGALNLPTSARLSFYSIGESLDLALLDTRVTTLMSALAAAIP